MKNIPALPFMKAVRQWAEAHNMKFFTWPEQMKAIAHYEFHAKVLN